MLSHPPQDIAIGILTAHASIVTNADVDTHPMMMKMTTELEENDLLKSHFNEDMKMETLKLISLVNHQANLTTMFFILKSHQSLFLQIQKFHHHLCHL